MTLTRGLSNARIAATARHARRAVAVGGLVGALAAGTALAATSHMVSQRGRAFNVKEIAVAVGDVVRFLNDDEFIHQIYIGARNFTFDSAEAAPGAAIDVRFTEAGTFDVRCHIHPKMQLKVTVR